MLQYYEAWSWEPTESCSSPGSECVLYITKLEVSAVPSSLY